MCELPIIKGQKQLFRCSSLSSSQLLLCWLLSEVSSLALAFLGKGSNTDGVADVPAASSEITITDGEPFDGTIDNGKDNTEQETRFIEQHRAW